MNELETIEVQFQISLHRHAKSAAGKSIAISANRVFSKWFSLQLSLKRSFVILICNFTIQIQPEVSLFITILLLNLALSKGNIK